MVMMLGAFVKEFFPFLFFMLEYSIKHWKLIVESKPIQLPYRMSCS
ncbi:hypothetical protein DERF_006083 [Dermatophagoides farinae]|uniref:Uncharacterized protein n=1 Tax=Dermatophagoides farinae TaxID=6954 RepID=A0A922I4S8_DERFA|nr:hypothetical protein DERF_006083 [Dermatophagoides farinae]